MDNIVMSKAVAIATAYVERIHPGADFGTGAWFYYLNNALSNIQITDSEYDKIISLSKAIIIKYSVFQKPKIEILDEKLLEKIVVDSKMGKPADERLNAIVEEIKRKAAEYAEKINTQAEFGTNKWMEDLWEQTVSGRITEDEYEEISDFVEMNKPLLCNDEESKDFQWACLLGWIKKLPEYHYETNGVEFTPRTADFFRTFFDEDKDKLSDRDYVLIALAFKDIEAMRNGEFDGSYAEEKDKLHEFNKISLSLFIIFVSLGLILPGLVVCLENGSMGENFFEFVVNCFLGLGAITLFAGFIYYPIMIIGSMLIANAVARAAIYKGKEPDKDVEQAGRHSVIGAAAGSAHIAGGLFRELSKPGWIKDSKKV